jgi:hypothetical protein
MTASKNVSWTPANTELLVAAYTGDNSKLEDLAKEFGKTVPMIRSKLVSEKVYKANAKVSTKTGVAPVRKAAMVRLAEEALSLENGALESFEKGSKADLETLVSAIEALTVTLEDANES